MPTDEELMTAYVAGDQAAFRRLFDRYAGLLLRVMRRSLAQPDEAHDLVQHTFLQLHRARHDYRPGAPVRPWLFTIAFNLKREHFRRAGRRREEPLPTDTGREPAAPDRDPEAAAEDGRVRAALAQLSESQREVILLHWFAGLAFPEVARVTGASLSAVKVRAHRAYERLRPILGLTGVTNPPPDAYALEEKPR